VIVTVTCNPALDKTANIERLCPGGLNRLSQVVADAGGKGVNVAKLIAALGGQAVATGFLGGGVGVEIGRALERLGVAADFVPVAGTTRTNLKLVDADGGLTELNEPGPDVGPNEWAALEAKLTGWARPGNVIVLAGSLPGGSDSGTYARLVRLAAAGGAEVYVDADGQALAQAVAAGPDLIKPNGFELGQLVAAPGKLGLAEVAVWARRLVAGGVKRVVVSLGGDGAVFVDADQACHAPALPVPVRSTVGAGDSLLAGLAWGLGQGHDFRQAAAWGMAAAAGAVTTVGTKAPDRGLIDRLLPQVEMRDLSLRPES
jgi:1-phosphofructokinase